MYYESHWNVNLFINYSVKKRLCSVGNEEQKLCITGLLAKPIQMWPQGTKPEVKSSQLLPLLAFFFHWYKLNLSGIFIHKP